MTLLLLAVILCLVAIVFVLIPLQQDIRPLIEIDKLQQALETLHGQKKRLYEGIRDLDFDFEVGKLAENDYRRLRDETMTEVSTVMREIESLEKRQGGNGQIEDEAIEKFIQQQRQGKESTVRYCTHCGHQIQRDANFCSECGTSLQPSGQE